MTLVPKSIPNEKEFLTVMISRTELLYQYLIRTRNRRGILHELYNKLKPNIFVKKHKLSFIPFFLNALQPETLQKPTCGPCICKTILQYQLLTTILIDFLFISLHRIKHNAYLMIKPIFCKKIYLLVNKVPVR